MTSGDVVVLKNESTKMTVENVHHALTATVWFDEKSGIHRGWFPTDSLVVVEVN